MNAPQITMIILIGIGLGMAAEQHGKPKTGKHSVWANIIGIGIQSGLLYWGGFF